jgi:hypothetical protein
VRRQAIRDSDGINAGVAGGKHVNVRVGFQFR